MSRESPLQKHAHPEDQPATGAGGAQHRTSAIFTCRRWPHRFRCPQGNQVLILSWKTVLQRLDHMIKGQETGTAVSPLWVCYTVVPVPFAVSADVTSISCRPSCSLCPPGLRCWCEADHHPEDNPLPDCSSALEGPQTPPPPPHPGGNHFHPTPSGSL